MADDDTDAKGLRAQIAEQARINAARLADLAARDAKISELEAGTQTYAQQVQALTQARDAEAARAAALAQDLDLAGIGLTDRTGRIVARALYEDLPADTRPKSLTEWVTALKTAPDAAPPGLAAYLGGPARAAGAAAGTTRTDDRPPPGGPGTTAGAGTLDTAAMRAKMVRGTMTPEERSQYLAALATKKS
jgi:hypothetical protein